VIVRWWDGWLSRALAVALAAASATSSVPAKGPEAGRADAESAVTASHYMLSNVDAASATTDDRGYQTGCADGKAGVSGPRALFFGTQESDGRIRPPGTTASSPAARVSEDWVERTAAGWVRGFTECGSATATVALGVNNKSDGGADAAQAGALDGEPSWSKPAWARDWVDAFVAGTRRELYAVNSADGCPTDGAGETCGNGWTVADVFHVSTGAADTVTALPQIYRTDGIQARQWAAISQWGAHTGAGPLRVAGTLTQQTACRQKSGCARTANSPADARSQLTDALAADPATRPTAPLAASDIGWSTSPPTP
jgi:hypothetical protein